MKKSIGFVIFIVLFTFVFNIEHVNENSNLIVKTSKKYVVNSTVQNGKSVTKYLSRKDYYSELKKMKGQSIINGNLNFNNSNLYQFTPLANIGNLGSGGNDVVVYSSGHMANINCNNSDINLCSATSHTTNPTSMYIEETTVIINPNSTIGHIQTSFTWNVMPLYRDVDLISVSWPKNASIYTLKMNPTFTVSGNYKKSWLPYPYEYFGSGSFAASCVYNNHKYSELTIPTLADNKQKIYFQLYDTGVIAWYHLIPYGMYGGKRIPYYSAVIQNVTYKLDADFAINGVTSWLSSVPIFTFGGDYVHTYRAVSPDSINVYLNGAYIYFRSNVKHEDEGANGIFYYFNRG